MSAPRASSIRAVLFDVGNVVVSWSPKRLYAKIFEDPSACDRFLAEVCTMAWHGETDRGLSFAENIRRLSQARPEHSEAIAAWWSRWPEMFGGVIPETVEAIFALHAAGTPIFGLTNMSLEAWPGVRAMSPVFECFKDVVVSGAHGRIKPEPEIFQIALDRCGYEAGELLFVDDSSVNIEAAARLGFRTHRFDEPAALGRVLREHALL